MGHEALELYTETKAVCVGFPTCRLVAGFARNKVLTADADAWQVKLPGGISATPAVHATEPQVFIGLHTGSIRVHSRL
jgi:hypothetical protein